MVVVCIVQNITVCIDRASMAGQTWGHPTKWSQDGGKAELANKVKVLHTQDVNEPKDVKGVDKCIVVDYKPETSEPSGHGFEEETPQQKRCPHQQKIFWEVYQETELSKLGSLEHGMVLKVHYGEIQYAQRKAWA